jgi:hypothetical protein
MERAAASGPHSSTAAPSGSSVEHKPLVARRCGARTCDGAATSWPALLSRTTLTVLVRPRGTAEVRAWLLDTGTEGASARKPAWVHEQAAVHRRTFDGRHRADSNLGWPLTDQVVPIRVGHRRRRGFRRSSPQSAVDSEIRLSRLLL